MHNCFLVLHSPLRGCEATILVQDTLFYVRPCKGMVFEGGQPVYNRLSERGAVMEALISVRSFTGF